VRAGEVACGAHGRSRQETKPSAGPEGSTNVVAEIALDADYEFYGHHNGIRNTVDAMLAILNAVDAMEEHGGTLGVSVRRRGGLVVARIEDDGPGIADEVAETLFDPFVTTKGAGRGSGLGLAVARGIASDHGGKLTLVRGSPGACFELRLSVAPQAEV